ncbi:hypothetical protein CBM2634_U70001 [Cupriavidus taiwanensis]|uniref:Uncharacterized protein n=1 Tax=Cupriavidus taiwanensis TaxID=164546 RepID=A0A375JDK9_9BURK|nr:hypothetical protein CBM2634_U70001 [Cupriavidus taiwanensis]
MGPRLSNLTILQVDKQLTPRATAGAHAARRTSAALVITSALVALHAPLGDLYTFGWKPDAKLIDEQIRASWWQSRRHGRNPKPEWTSRSRLRARLRLEARRSPPRSPRSMRRDELSP